MSNLIKLIKISIKFRLAACNLEKLYFQKMYRIKPYHLNTDVGFTFNFTNSCLDFLFGNISFKNLTILSAT